MWKQKFKENVWYNTIYFKKRKWHLFVCENLYKSITPKDKGHDYKKDPGQYMKATFNLCII